MFNLGNWLLKDNSSNRCFKIIKTNNYLSHNCFSHVDNNNFCNNVTTMPNSTHSVTAKGDSAATGHFFTVDDSCVLKQMKKESGLSVTLPDNDVIESSHSAQLPTPHPLPPAATKTSIFPQLASSSLVSLPIPCA